MDQEKLNEIPLRVKQSIHHLDKNAKVILFGSKARGDDNNDSDWDFLILLDIPVSAEIKEEIRLILYSIELDVEQVITSIIEDQFSWDLHHESELYENVSREGIEINDLIAA